MAQLETNMTQLETWLPMVAMFVGAGLALFTASLILWTVRDAASRTGSRVLQLLAMAVVLALNIVGLVIYLLIRAPETIAERREREMIEAILAREVTGQLPRR